VLDEQQPASPIIRPTTKVGYHNDDDDDENENDEDANYAPLNDETIASLVAAIEAKCAEQQPASSAAADNYYYSSCDNHNYAYYGGYGNEQYDRDAEEEEDDFDPFDAPVSRMFGRNGNHAASYSAIHNYNAYIKPQQSVNKVANMKKQRCRKLYNKTQTKAYHRARDAKTGF